MTNRNPEIIVRRLQKTSITPGLMSEFAHKQMITRKWVKRNDVWEITDASLLREWSAEKRIWITEYMLRQTDRGGVVLGAYCREQMTGFCCVDGVISGESAKYANLTMLSVDDRRKRCGIGRLLFREARRCALTMGAEKLFISAIPSAETIAFYQNMGCTDANEIIESFVDSEDDRPLEITVQ